MKKLPVRLLATLLLLLVSWSKASASEQLVIVPASPGKDPNTSSIFVYKLKAGQQQKDTAAIVNLLDREIEVDIYPVDATTTKDGKFVFEDVNKQAEDVGVWVGLETDSLKLLPKQRKTFDFTITAPANARAGDHLGGLAIRSSDGLEAAAKVYTTIEGEVARGLEIGDITVEKAEGKVFFITPIKNTGDIRIEAVAVSLELKNKLLPGPLRTQTLPFDIVLFPKGEIELRVPWEGGLDVFGKYQTKLIVRYGQGEEQSKDVSSFFFFSPKRIVSSLGVLLAFILLFVAGIKLFIKGFRQLRRGGGKLGLPKISFGKKRSDFELQDVSDYVKRQAGEEIGSSVLFEVRRIVREELELNRHIEDVKREKRAHVLEEVVSSGALKNLLEGKKKRKNKQ